jgi:hypothetical protein
MFGITPGTHLFLLQMKYFKDDNPLEGMILVIAIGAVIVLAIIFQIIRFAVSRSVTGKSKTQVTSRKFKPFAISRISSAYGLNKDQRKLLEFVFRNDEVSEPERVMKNPMLLDRHFKQAYKAIVTNSMTEEDAQERLVKLFTLRNVLDVAAAGSSSPGHITANTQAILMIGNENYPVKVLSSSGQSVATEIPKTVLGTPIRILKGAKVSISFPANGFSFDGQFIGTVNTDNGSGLQIVNTGKAKALIKRKSRRKQTNIRCDFFLVLTEETGTGKKKTSKLVVDSRRFTGAILDLSVGGCSIRTRTSIPAGSRLKIIIDYDNEFLITVLGQVLRLNRSGSAGTILHIKFLKIPRRAFNSISALVFGYKGA